MRYISVYSGSGPPDDRLGVLRLAAAARGFNRDNDGGRFSGKISESLEQLEKLRKIDIVTVKKNVFQRMGEKQWDEEIVQ